MQQLDDKVAAVTGAGSGIGRALALELAGRGCRLALSDVDAAGLAETERLLDGRARALTLSVVDVADEAAVLGWADQVVADHGRANLVVNNAGVALSGTVAALSTDDYRWIMGINFWGVVHGTKAFLPHLEASGEGHVVNISSVFGLTAQPLMSGYNASKYAVRGFTESLRQDLDLTGARRRERPNPFVEDGLRCSLSIPTSSPIRPRPRLPSGSTPSLGFPITGKRCS